MKASPSTSQFTVTPTKVPYNGVLTVDIKGVHGISSETLPTVILRKRVPAAQPPPLNMPFQAATGDIAIGTDIRILKVDVGHAKFQVPLEDHGVEQQNSYDVFILVGGKLAHSTIVYSKEVWVGLISAVSPILCLLLIGGAIAFKRGNPWALITINQGRTCSLSKFQILLWSSIVVCLSIYVFWANESVLEVTPQFVILLGVVGGSSVASQAIVSGTQALEQVVKKDSRKGTLSDLIMDEDGDINMMRLQMLMFTLFAAYMVARHTCVHLTFPEIPTTLLTLMGISQGTYLLDKVQSYNEAKQRYVIASSITPKQLNDLTKAFTIYGRSLNDAQVVTLIHSGGMRYPISGLHPVADTSIPIVVPEETYATLPEGKFSVEVLGKDNWTDTLHDVLEVLKGTTILKIEPGEVEDGKTVVKLIGKGLKGIKKLDLLFPGKPAVSVAIPNPEDTVAEVDLKGVFQSLEKGSYSVQGRDDAFAFNRLQDVLKVKK